mgnify:CR=1 FL=1|tara:strand:+ start:724 stop:1011 length:288 start_codon:yes stop_codon:yes gene_type:complete
MKKVNLIDVRTAEEYNNEPIPNTINIPLNEFPIKLDQLRELQPLVVFCSAGVRSQKAIDILIANDIFDVENGGNLISIKDRINKIYSASNLYPNE